MFGLMQRSSSHLWSCSFISSILWWVACTLQLHDCYFQLIWLCCKLEVIISLSSLSWETNYMKIKSSYNCCLLSACCFHCCHWSIKTESETLHDWFRMGSLSFYTRSNILSRGFTVYVISWTQTWKSLPMIPCRLLGLSLSLHGKGWT